MFGPSAVVDSMILRAGAGKAFKHGNLWQYHSRSDHHSTVACWGLLLDLLTHCSLLRSHAEQGLVGYGINHEMRDFRTGRKKKLDLVLCRPRSEPENKRRRRRTFAERGTEIGVVMSSAAGEALSALPPINEFAVGAVHLAVEAKACMTAFGKARPRLYDELNSSHLAIHGNSDHAIAAGLFLVNVADTFVSPGLNDFDLKTHAARVSTHRQPQDALGVIEKLREVPRRSREGDEGFDAFAITVVDCRNDGSPVRLVEAMPAPQEGDIYHYEWTVHRLAQLYEQKFRNISVASHS